MACNILLQTGGKIQLQSGDGYLLLTNCVIDEFQPLGNKKEYIRHDYDLVYKRVIEEYQKEQKTLAQAESAVIDLRQRAQEARIEQLRLQKIQGMDAEIAALERAVMYLMETIEQETKRILVARNNLAMLVLMLSDPFLMVGGVKVLH